MRDRSGGSLTGYPPAANERMYLYLCEDLEPGPTDHQPDEKLEPVIVPWPEAIRLVLEGQIEDAKTSAEGRCW